MEQTIYVKDVINERSEYVWMAGFDSDFTASGNAGTDIDSGDNFIQNISQTLLYQTTISH